MSTARKFPAEDSVVLLMRIALHGLRRSFTARLAEYEIPYSVWYFLRILWEDDGLSQKDLTRRAGVLQPNAVSAIRTMEEMGLARVERSVDDRRRIRVWLTPKAKELEELVLPKIREDADRLAFHNFDEEERQMLTTLLKKVCNNVAGRS